ncbi:SDR family NAD(P)-dependent oxidoreductase [Duganella aceris]|uniref:NADP-dependent 3-hydroxy acid dehydrogenase YdfG n=1 Tax=Duganella aceris TaxID=2703883 RepID=A0ABX0FR10_9BURK|nr:SDR family oxidoreductase [Duganella aceris]NGZ86926.1 SDR family oxidoreductase [Duganella aceris]
MAAFMKTAVVTGASSGIGAVYADRLAARGYDLILIARRADRLTALADRLSTQYGVGVKTLVADLEKSDDVAKVEDVLANDGSIKVLVNNAGLARLRTMADSSRDDTRAQIALNITALTRLTETVLPAFVARNEGTIINVASVLAVKSWAMSSVYSGTKAYVLMFSRGIQDELANAKSSVRLQVVLPASTATEIWTEGVSGIPLSALGQDTIMSAEDCVDAALAGLDKGELVTMPSVEDDKLLSAYDTAREALFTATQTGTPASRYRKT